MGRLEATTFGIDQQTQQGVLVLLTGYCLCASILADRLNFIPFLFTHDRGVLTRIDVGFVLDLSAVEGVLKDLEKSSVRIRNAAPTSSTDIGPSLADDALGFQCLRNGGYVLMGSIELEDFAHDGGLRRIDHQLPTR
jgi:hypothetical protein